MLIIFSIIAIFAVIWFYSKTVPDLNKTAKFLLIFLRIISLLTILILLFNPIFRYTKKQYEYPSVVFLNDISLSMHNAGEKEKTEAFTQMYQNASKLLENSTSRFLEFPFADGINGSSSTTLLGKTLKELQEQKKLTSAREIILNSDGWLKDENFSFLKKLNIPITVLIPDYSYKETDIELSQISYNRNVYQSEEFPLKADVKARNYRGKAQVVFTSGNTIIATKEIEFDDKDVQTVEFSHSVAETGLFTFDVKVKTDSEIDINLDNNSYPGAIQVLNTKNEIVIITDQLNWDVKFIKDAINSNENWLTRVVIYKNNVFTLANERVEIENLLNENCKALVIVNSGNLQFSQGDTQYLIKSVEQGKGLVTMGLPLQELNSILPIYSSNITKPFSAIINLTEVANKYQTFSLMDNQALEDIPELDFFYVNSKLEAEIIAKMANEQNSPGIVFSNAQRGKVLSLAFTGLWKWQLRGDNNSFQQFFTSVINWLTNNQSGNFLAIIRKNSFFSGENITINLQAYDERMNFRRDINAQLTIKNSAGQIVLEDLMHRENDNVIYSINDLPPEKYTYEIADNITLQKTEGSFVVVSGSNEIRDLGINNMLLTYLAKETDGKIITPQNMGEIIIDSEETREIKTNIEIPLYRKWYLIALFLSAFCLELFLRKRWGLL
ncbi:MAG: hypothetical protein PHR06_01980 [Candidatus Cloacimonetes bacterium]|nr:hypothetical protein [Candidatus Cloacimonadota bacterium]